MNILEPCCYTKQFNEYLYSTKSDVIPVYHSGDIYAAHIIERVQMLAPGGSQLFIVLPHITGQTIDYIRKAAQRKYYDERQQQNALKFTTINIITEQPSDKLTTLAATLQQPTNLVTVKNVGINLIVSISDQPDPSDDNFRCHQCILVQGSIIQTTRPGIHLLTIHRGTEQKNFIIPFLQSKIRTYSRK